MEDLLSQLLNRKALPPRHEDADSVLERIARLHIDDFNEAEVRAEIIDPLVRILGYDIASHFSLKREKAVPVLGSSKAIDYSMTLFAENFWLIEAKRPGTADRFDRDTLYQALRYAAHPAVNAALLVLCDGNRLEVFDREETLQAPILSLRRQEFARDFDKLRALLSPWQAFFFERRRVLRLIDKVFDRETHLSRLEEMKSEIDRRLADKRMKVLANLRERTNLSADISAHADYLAAADPEELIEVHLFSLQRGREVEAISLKLSQDLSDLPHLWFRLLPDRPRAANLNYWGHVLHLLASLDRNRAPARYLPDWLGGGSAPEIAIERLIPLMLTGFAGDRERRLILQYSSAARRILKLQLLASSARRAGEVLHAMVRYLAPELSFTQGASTPSRQLLLQLDPLELRAIHEFVRNHVDDRNRFLTASAEQVLREAWQTEIKMLDAFSDHRTLLVERQMDDPSNTEDSEVVYDQLGHLTLCVLEDFPDWKEWTLAKHREKVVDVGRFGSWQARKWLGLSIDQPMEAHPPQTVARRFFLGDTEIALALAKAYGWQ